jgi:hypothetical protein
MVDIDLDAVLAKAKPKTVKVGVCLRGDLIALHDDLERQFAEGRRLDETENRHVQAPDLARKLKELEEQIDAEETVFEFKAIGQKAWTDLIEKHPASEDDQDKGYAWDPANFPKAALMASASNPTISAEQFDQLFAILNLGQWNKLFGGVLAANVKDVIPFSEAASVVLSGSEMKSS